MKDKGFVMTPNILIKDDNKNHLLVYVMMKYHAGASGECYAGVQRLAKELNIGRIAVRESQKFLENIKLIYKIGKKQAITLGGLQYVQVYGFPNSKMASVFDDKGGLCRPPQIAKGGLEESKGWSVQPPINIREEKNENGVLIANNMKTEDIENIKKEEKRMNTNALGIEELKSRCLEKFEAHTEISEEERRNLFNAQKLKYGWR